MARNVPQSLISAAPIGYFTGMESAPSDIASELRAFAALPESARFTELLAVARECLKSVATGRQADWADQARVDAAAESHKVQRSEADTPFGNVLSVLARGPEDAAERSLARALAAHAFATEDLGNVDSVASDLLWLSANTPFDATLLLPRAFGDRLSDILVAIADRAKRLDDRGAHGRAEALAACACLASLPEASVHARKLISDLRDPSLVRLLSVHNQASVAGAELLQGELRSAPRGTVLTAVLGLTGILALRHAVSLLLRLALGLRRPCEVTFSQASIQIKSRLVVLGRTVREDEHVILRSALVRAAREVRYPRVGLYAGLAALALGTWCGVSLFVDGARAASPSLLLWGVLLVLVGVGVEFVLSSLWPNHKGECQLAFTPKAGSMLYVTGVDRELADKALSRLR